MATLNSKIISQNEYASLEKNKSVIEKKISTILNAQLVNPCNPAAVVKAILGNKKPGSKSNGKIGSGVYGTVRVYDAGDDHFFAVKTAKGRDDDLLHEYTVLKLMYKRGFNVPKPYALRYCQDSYGKRNIIYYEYADGGDLRNYLRNLLEQKTTKSVIEFQRSIKSILTQVFVNLYNAQKQLKGFRHFDLHPGNILVTKRGKTKGYSEYNMGKTKILKENAGIMSYMHDFAFSDCDILPNEYQRKHPRDFADYGIVKNSHPLYDVHFLLNSLYLEFGHAIPFLETVRMITEVLPGIYLGKETPFVKNHRLRGNVKHRLPSFETILKNSYFTKKKKKTKVDQVIDKLLIKRTKEKHNHKIHGGYNLSKQIKLTKDKKEPGAKTLDARRDTKIRILQGATKNINKMSRSKEKQADAASKGASITNAIKKYRRQDLKKEPTKQKQISRKLTFNDPKGFEFIPFTKDKKGRLRIRGRLCSAYKKADLQKVLQKKKLDYKGKTIKQMCDTVVKKYTSLI